MTQSTVETDVLQAIHEGALSPYGTARAQVRGSTTYVAIPIQLANALCIQQGMGVQRAYDPETGCLIACLRDDYNLFTNNL